MIPKKSIEEDWASQKPNELKLVYGLTLEQEPEVYRDVKIFFNERASKFIVTSNKVLEVVGDAAAKAGAKRASAASVSPAPASDKGSLKPAPQADNQYVKSEIELQFLLLQY